MFKFRVTFFNIYRSVVNSVQKVWFCILKPKKLETKTWYSKLKAQQLFSVHRAISLNKWIFMLFIPFPLFHVLSQMGELVGAVRFLLIFFFWVPLFSSWRMKVYTQMCLSSSVQAEIWRERRFIRPSGLFTGTIYCLR